MPEEGSLGQEEGAGRRPLTRRAIQTVLELLEREYGLSLRDRRVRRVETEVERRVEKAGFGDPEGYLAFLLSGDRGARELRQLACNIANHETYFFREPVHLEILKQYLQELHQQVHRTGTAIRLVSAGSSTGEEAYSMAASVLETGLFTSGKWQLDVLGIDLDPAAIETATSGVYPGYSMRGVDPRQIRMWFQDLGDGRFRVKEELRNHVRFSCENVLGQPGPDELMTAHIVFCRNVLIYMNAEGADRLSERLHARLVPGGWLFIGRSETLVRRRDLFDPLRLKQTVVYVKR